MKKIVFILILVLIFSLAVTLKANNLEPLNVIPEVNENPPPVTIYNVFQLSKTPSYQSKNQVNREDWDPTDPLAKWIQDPDPLGWDVYATSPMILADDWQCTEDGYIKDIHFWGSWLSDDLGIISSFVFNIYSDIPVDFEGNNYSYPGDLLWSYEADLGTFNIVEQGPSPQGWYYPPDNYILPNHNQWFRYDVILPADKWFHQQGTDSNPIVYWLSITANVAGANENWGWKSSVDHWNDDAVYLIESGGTALLWGELYQPNPVPNPNPDLDPDPPYISTDLAFVLTGDSELPVELSSFSGTFNSDLCSSMLSWTTQSESGNMGWNVYRSTSNSVEESVQLNASIISGAGTTSEPTNYEFQDQNNMELNTEYKYWLECLSFDGEAQQFGPIVINTLSEEEQPDPPELVTAMGLQQNYPNPFNPNTQISFIMEKAGECELTIYDIKGKVINNLFQGNIEADKSYSITWNGRDNSGEPVTSGIYLYKIKSGRYIETKKMILMK